VGCVSGAQLATYATFLLHPEQAPLSIVLTALSTAAAIAMTPLLSLLLLGTRVPVDVAGMAASIVQIVIVPVAAGEPWSCMRGARTLVSHDVNPKPWCKP
jgi:predicted Na+-dependent transporter